MAEVGFDVLRSRAQVDAAERQLHERELVRRPGALRRLRRDPFRSDPLKSWDVLRTLDAVLERVPRDAPVLDIGSFASAIPPALAAAGYTQVAGIDLDPQVRGMPAADRVEYVVGDLMETGWPDDRFAAVTAISVIEHGFEADRLLPEVARLLAPGGVFLFSTDYWPDKIDTSDTPLFGMTWTIFSAPEIEELVDRARNHGLVPASDSASELRDVGEAPIDFAGRRYTFLHGALVYDGR
jgi:SAM-dependent methyltransferase